MSDSPRHLADMRPTQYRFGDFTLDLEGGFLRRGDEEVPLRPKSFEALTFLVERHGRLVGKTELVDAIWPGTAVTDNSLAQCLADIRRALGDESHQTIRTLARRGYLFAAPVIVAPAFTQSTADAVEAPAPPPASRSPARAPSGTWMAAGALVGVLIIAATFALPRVGRRPEHNLIYTQLTDFTESVVAPALARDGRMLAFMRGEQWFSGTDQIYVKMLPGGDAVRLTNDSRQKYGMAFSPDGSQIAYTAWGDGHGFNTYAVSVLGSEPTLLLPNAAGLTWLNDQRLLFAEIKTGMHLGIVTATVSRADRHEVYFPEHERAMAHYAFASPDRRWALVIEMDHRPVWLPCRLVPMDGLSPGRPVGPHGMCTGAGWSPDGTWMYFTAAVDEAHHLWRQQFPRGVPEQLTYGPAEEDGVAVTPDGAVITSIGLQRTALWMSDRHGNRPLSSEGAVVYHIGDASLPTFAPDGRWVFYLRESAGSPRQLWKVDVESGRSEPVFSGIAVKEFDLSPDGNEVVFSTEAVGSKSRLWLGPVDRRTPPKLIASDGENAPRFGLGGRVLFRFTENNLNYLGQMNRDGSDRSKVVAYPVSTFMRISPDRRWLLAIVPQWGPAGAARTVAIPTAGGPPHAICINTCLGGWSPDGQFFYVASNVRTRTDRGGTIAIPVVRDTGLPNLPEGGITLSQADAIPGRVLIEQGEVIPGPDPSTYAYVKTTGHRNLFQIGVH